MLRGIKLEAVKVDAQGRTFGAGARQAEHDARSVFQPDADALRAADRSVDRVDVREVAGAREDAALHRPAGQGRERFAQVGDQAVRGRTVYAFVVMARVVVAALGLSVLAHDLLDGLAAYREDVEPEPHGPGAVLLAPVI